MLKDITMTSMVLRTWLMALSMLSEVLAIWLLEQRIKSMGWIILLYKTRIKFQETKTRPSETKTLSLVSATQLRGI